MSGATNPNDSCQHLCSLPRRNELVYEWRYLASAVGALHDSNNININEAQMTARPAVTGFYQAVRHHGQQKARDYDASGELITSYKFKNIKAGVRFW